MLFWTAQVSAAPSAPSSYYPGFGDRVYILYHGRPLGFRSLGFTGEKVLSSTVNAPITFIVGLDTEGHVVFRTSDRQFLCQGPHEPFFLIVSHLPDDPASCLMTLEPTEEGFGIKAENGRFWRPISVGDGDAITATAADLSDPQLISFTFVKVN
jgi:hypothetical protein